MVLCMPFKWIAPKIEQKAGVGLAEPYGELDVEPEQLASLIEIIGPRMRIFECKCLPQAMCGKWMLSRRGVATTLHLGLRKGPEADLLAHAWLSLNGRTIVGGTAEKFYQVGEF